MTVSYSDLSESSALTFVPASVHLLADQAKVKAAMELALARPRLVWFTEAQPNAPGAYPRPFSMKGESRGFENAIWLHVGLRGDDLLSTVAHECRHLWQ
jgi:hypothetical protein